MYWKRWGRVKETVCNNDIKQCIVRIHKRAESQRHEYSLSLGFPHFCITAFYNTCCLSRYPCPWNKPTQYSNVKNINIRSIERDLSWHQETQPKQIFVSFSCTAEGGQQLLLRQLAGCFPCSPSPRTGDRVHRAVQPGQEPCPCPGPRRDLSFQNLTATYSYQNSVLPIVAQGWSRGMEWCRRSLEASMENIRACAVSSGKVKPGRWLIPTSSCIAPGQLQLPCSAKQYSVAQLFFLQETASEYHSIYLASYLRQSEIWQRLYWWR